MTGTTSHRPNGNLPGATTSFIGRRREIITTKRLLSTTRLVTLTGVAGVGKTRLALRVAAQLHEKFPDGVWLVELAALTEDKLLPQAVADTLGIQDQSARPLLDTLTDYLADKQLLLVLDNCEHLVDPCAILTDKLLRAAPELRILATSRHALRTSGEQLLQVAPLPMPDPNQAQSQPTRYAAVRLFAERAATALPGFRVDARNRDAITRICHRLDGIPLAIELAAVRVRAMPVHQILRRLDDYFEFLAEGSRTSIPACGHCTPRSTGASTSAQSRNRTRGHAHPNSSADSTWTRPKPSARRMTLRRMTCWTSWLPWWTSPS
jgi:predicted ATPase